jgi:hypothetical protein
VYSKFVSAVLGLIALGVASSAYQTLGQNWVGQVCFPGPCWRPEWLVAGGAVAAVAYFLWPRQG